MKSFFALCPGILWSLVVINAFQDPYSAQPRIITQDGHMIFMTSENRNISFQSKGTGKIRINNDDLIELVDKTKRSVEQLENFRNTEVAELRQQITNLRGNEYVEAINRRLTQVESTLTTLATQIAAAANVTIRQQSNRVRILTNKVSTIERKLAADECQSNPCRNGGTCEDGYNKFICRCLPGWQGPVCDTDVYECSQFVGTAQGCQNGATCSNTQGSYRCECTPNWYGVHCTERHDECSTSSNSALCDHGTCISRISTQAGQPHYTCICEQGWQTDGRNPACNVDINECQNSRPPCSHQPLVQCINVPGTFYCGPCPTGYTGNGYVCSDIDECSLNNGGCSITPMVQCFNTLGSRQCGPCPPGYQGDGSICIYIGACAFNNGGCHPLATCIENQRISSAYRECRCAAGYIGTGLGPNGCVLSSSPNSGGNEMIVRTNPCEQSPCIRGTCVIIGPNSFRCNCPQGYAGQTCEIDLDECLSSPCQNGGTCQNQPGGFRCTCPSDYTGATCETQSEICGAYLNSENGTFRYPANAGTRYSHDRSCAWVITTVRGKVINATFPEFHLESSYPCDYDFLQLHDGSSASDHPIGKYCGNSPPRNGSIVSTHNQLYLWFRSDSSVSHDGFRVNWTSINPICGGDLDSADFGAISSPGYPGKYPHGRDCVWTVRVPLGKRIKFLFATLQLENHANCSYDFLELRDGLRESDPVLGKYCSTVTPAPIETSGSFARLYFHSDISLSDYGFHITYTSMPGVHGCGGLLTTEKGSFSSPAYPNHYSHGLECDWLIRAKPRERIRLKFTNIHLENGPQCNYDYIEVRDGRDEEGAFVGKYCGTTNPPVHVSAGNNLFIRFRTDISVSRPGFQAEYEIICGGSYDEDSGIVHSPNYPNPYPTSRQCIYIIRQPVGKSIKLQFQGFDIEAARGDPGSCQFDYLEIRDGDSEESPLISTLCGVDIPDDILSTHNILWMKFVTDSSVQNRGFLANYSTIDIACGGILTEPTGRISSPSHPEEYIHGANCNWIIRVRSGNFIRLNFLSFTLEGDRACRYDYVAIYDNVTTASDTSLIGRFCGIQRPPTITSMDTTLFIVFKSDDSVTREGFSAEYTIIDGTTACGGEYRTQVGAIKSPNYPNDYPHNKQCIWTITVPQGQQIELNVSRFELESHTNCRYDYLEIRNGGYETSPLIGKYCGTIIPKLIPSHGPNLWIKFVTDSSSSDKGFQIFWDGTVTGCGGRLTSASGSFASPNYPSSCSSGVPCEWDIIVSKGNYIRISFADWDHSPRCNNNGLELWRQNGPILHKINQYCGDHVPEPVTITSNQAVVKYRCARFDNHRGFHLRYTTDCNIALNGRTGVIESPNYPDFYPANRNCTWKIRAPEGNTINLTFSNGHLELGQGCRYDFLEIKDLERDENNVLGKFCGPVDLSNTIATNSSYISVQFVTDATVESAGFHMEWVTDGCGGHLIKPEGILTSPNYPNPFSKSVTCQWQITVDIGSSIEFTIENYNTDGHTSCYSNYIKVFGGPNSDYPELVKLCNRLNSPKVITSSGHNLLIEYKRYGGTSRGEGFSASYRTIHSGCGGNFTTDSGVITSKNFPANYGANDDCTWLITVHLGHRVVLTFTSFDIQPGNNCSATFVSVHDGPNEDSQPMVQHCGNSLPNATYTSTRNVMVVKMKAEGSISAKGFQANYVTGCGSDLYADEIGELTSPNYPQYPVIDRLNCTWIIRARYPEDKVSLTFTTLDYGLAGVGRSNYRCNYNMSYIDIYDGQTLGGNRILRICSSKIPPAIFSMSNAMYIIAYTNYHEMKFRAVFREASTGCGGEMQAMDGMFTSPGFPESYEPSEECVWTLFAGPGNKIALNFRSFNLEESEYCNSDYVEVRERSAMGTLLGRFCGQQILMNNTLEAYEKMWVKFSSSDEGTASGFQAEFAIASSVELTGTAGEISNPLHTLTQQSSQTIDYYITVPMYKYVQITFTEFRVGRQWGRFMPRRTCSSYAGRIQIIDGRSDESPVLDTFCGSDIPDPIVSSSNEMTVKLLTDGYEPSQFHLRWAAVDYSPPPEETTEIVKRCVHEIAVSVENSTYIDMPTNSSVFDVMNSYLFGCEWIVRSPIGTRLRISFPNFNFRESGCYFNQLSLFDGGLQTGRWSPLRTLCSQDEFLNHVYTYSGGNVVKMNVSMSRHMGLSTSFTAAISAVCGGNVTNQVAGSIRSTYYPNDYPENLNCAWHIAVRPGKSIRTRFSDFDIRSNPPVCPEDYLVVRNGESSSSPFLGLGKYCGSNKPILPDSSGNHLYIQFISNLVGSGKGFELVFEEKGVDCGGSIRLGPNADNAVILTPNHPQIYPPHTECDWIITGTVGHRIRLDFTNSFDIPRDNECANDYVEIRDGGTRHSRLVVRACGHDLPHTAMSTNNLMFVHFFSNSNNPSVGFNATVKLARCGGTIASNREVVTSPNYPNRYSGTLNCEWTIRGPVGHYMTFNFNNIQLPTATDCLQTDYVEIRDLNSTGTLLGTFCGNTIPQPVSSADNIAYIRFVATGSNSLNGFQLSFQASVEVCGGDLSTPSGVITSPNFPGFYPLHRQCKWVIRVDPSRRIRMVFTHFDMNGAMTANIPNRDPYNFCQNFVYVLNGDSNLSPYLLRPPIACGSDIPEPVESDSNSMTVTFHSGSSRSGHGFRAEYSSDNEVFCGGVLPAPSGYFTTPGYHSNQSYIDNMYCTWTLTNPRNVNSSVAFFINEFSFESRSFAYGCIFDRLQIYDETTSDSPFEICGNVTPQVYSFPYSNLRIRVITDMSITHSGFNISYNIQDCGGIISGEAVITSPNYPNSYGNNVHCVWAINLPEGQQVHLRFTHLNIENLPDCPNDYVLVRSGPSLMSPIWKRSCGSVLPDEIRFHRNDILVEFHTNNEITGNGFRLEVQPIIGGCGGVLKHDLEGYISSTGFPAQYAANQECVWEIIVEPNYHVNLTFKDRFDLEQTANCDRDFIEVSQYFESGFRPIGNRLCGREFPAAIISSSNHVKIMFRTNENVDGDGFKIFWKRGCGGIITDSEGTISSPGFPQNYDNYLDCNYILQGDPEHYLGLTFDPQNFGIENADDCIFDRVEIYRGNTTSAELVGKYCGDTPPPTILSRGSLLLRFITDVTISRMGFIANYRISACGGVLTAPTGVLHTPTNPDNYLHYMNCTWIIYGQQDRIIELRFDAMSIELSSRCQYDYVAVFDGPNISSRLIGKYCGRREPFRIISETSNITVQFRSDHSIASSGFTAFYKSTFGEQHGCGGYVNGSSGSIQSLDYNRDGKYEPDLNCVWTIVGTSLKHLKLHFESFDVENGNCSYDYLQIRDGNSPHSPLVDKYCGSRVYSDIVLMGNIAWVQFVSDGRENRAGFRMTYTSMDVECQGSFMATNISQSIQSPGYPRHYPTMSRCWWVISAPENEKVEITFVDFELEDSPRCNKDVVLIKEVDQDTNVPTFRRCGSGRQPAYRSEQSQIYLQFASDDSGSAKGFNITYNIMSYCNRTYQSSHDEIRVFSTRGIPCRMLIEGPVGYTVTVYFDSLYVDDSTGCTDYFKAWDGPTETSTSISTICSAYRLQTPISSSGNKMLIEIRGTSQHTTFNGRYTTTNQGQGCGGPLHVVNPIFLRSPSNLSTSDGQILECKWIITVKHLENIGLRGGVFSMQPSENCTANYIELYENSIEDVAHRVGRYCNSDYFGSYTGEGVESVLVKYAFTGNSTDNVFSMSIYPRSAPRVITMPDYSYDYGNYALH